MKAADNLNETIEHDRYLAFPEDEMEIMRCIRLRKLDSFGIVDNRGALSS